MARIYGIRKKAAFGNCGGKSVRAQSCLSKVHAQQYNAASVACDAAAATGCCRLPRLQLLNLVERVNNGAVVVQPGKFSSISKS
mmetsp:Transcript_45385/g.87304  ORF Transcript_45385/g.87304 Transcript_45385/m.87304 type:complete len:84 (-) Transcript_45385:26-277(-)